MRSLQTERLPCCRPMSVDLAGEHRRASVALSASLPLDPPSSLNALSATGTARVWTEGDSGWVVALNCPLEKPYPIVDRFNDGLWFVADAGFYGGANGRLLTPDGALLGRFRLGDGIGHSSTDASSRIWVGWNDQGIGAKGDRDIDGHEYPPSLDGLGCFETNGALLPFPDLPFPAGFLIECYALNITGQLALRCFYSHTDSGLVQVAPGEPVRWWRSEFSDVSAIARDGRHALMAGGYGEDADRLVLVTLDGPGQGEDVRALAQWALPLHRRSASTNAPAPVW